MKNNFKIEMHVHTSECDKVANINAAEIVKLYAKCGYDAIVITDHYFETFFKWFKAELQNANHEKIIKRYLKGYYSARNEGEKNGIVVLPGAEVRLKDTNNDYLIYGLEERDFYNLPLLCNVENVDKLIEILPSYSYVVQAHPFRDNMTVKNPEKLFGIEVYNHSTDAFRNKMAQMFAEHYNLAGISGSDFHGVEALAKGGIVSERKIKNSGDLSEVLRNGKYSLIFNGKE